MYNGLMIDTALVNEVKTWQRKLVKAEDRTGCATSEYVRNFWRKQAKVATRKLEALLPELAAMKELNRRDRAALRG
jgi:hypothetical protein